MGPNWIKEKRKELLLILFTGMAAILIGASIAHMIPPIVLNVFAWVSVGAMILFMLSLFGLINL